MGPKADLIGARGPLGPSWALLVVSWGPPGRKKAQEAAQGVPKRAPGIVLEAFWGPFGSLFGFIFESFFGPRFWKPSGTHVGPFWDRLGAKWDPKNSKKR